MKLFDRIFHPEKVEVLEECARNWKEIYPLLTPEQYRSLTIPNKHMLITILPNINDVGFSSIPMYLTGGEYKNLLKAKAQLKSLKQSGLTDEQKLYLELVKGDNNE